MKEESPSNINLPSNIGSPESPACLKPSSSTTTTSTNNKEQDRFLPIANVGRIMKKVMPANGKISKDAKETVQECVSEFISFVTGEASDKCQREKRKTINGDDIIWAITTLGFDDYVDPLKSYLQKYREIEGEKLNVPKQQQQQQSRLHHHQQHNNNIPNIINNNLPLSNSIYSSNPFISHHQPLPHPHPPYVTSDQTFSLRNFSSNSIQKQLQPQDHMDSMGQWDRYPTVTSGIKPATFLTYGEISRH